MLWLLFYGFLATIGLSISYMAWLQFTKTQDLLKDGIKTKAKIIRLEVYPGDGNPVYSPVFEYKDRKNQILQYTSSIQSYPAPYEVGDVVAIVYDKQETATMKVLSFWDLYRGSVIPSMIAAPLLIIGFSYLAFRLL